MLPRNIVENDVRETLRALRENNAEAARVCWCPLCTADMQALALTSLPPKYVTRRLETAVDDPAHRRAVREEVARAIRHVGSRCKHQAGSAVPAGKFVAVVNLTFEVGVALIEQLMRAREGSCACPECRSDAIAFALNRFPSRYGVVLAGNHAFDEGNRQEIEAELASFLDLGASVVAAHPRHGTA